MKPSTNPEGLLNPEMVKEIIEAASPARLSLQGNSGRHYHRTHKSRAAASRRSLISGITGKPCDCQKRTRTAGSERALLVQEPFKGVRALAIRPEEIKEIFDVRALLEGHAVELAASRISLEELARMEDLLPSTVVSHGVRSAAPPVRRIVNFTGSLFACLPAKCPHTSP